MRCFLCFLLFISSPALAQLSADFSAVSTQGCSPLIVQFQDVSAGSPSEWFWDFGNGVTSSAQNPVVTYTDYGNYTVRLIIRNSLGEALAEKNGYIKVFPTPRANFSISNSSGCIPLLAAFQDNSELFGDSLKSRLWNFGDGNTSDQESPTNTFNSGRYNISLAIETQHGCVDTSTRINGVTAGSKPVAQFNAIPLSGCGSRARQFNNQSTGNITDSKWSFGDGGLSFDKHPLYYFQDSGQFYVKLVVSDNGCKDSIIKYDYIYVEAPAGKLLTTFDCKDRSTVTFTDRTKGALSRLWDFGDGQTSTDLKAVHTYTSPGTYIVKLSVTGTNCSDLERDTVYIKPPLPKVVVSPADSLHCKNRPLQFAVTGFDSAVSKYFSWNFKDGVITPSRSTTAVIFHTYKQAGVYQPYVDITDYAKCHDTIPILNPITIFGPTALFDSVGKGCSDQGISFIDKSTPDQNTPVTQWLWNFGDGITSATKDTNYMYAFAGTYNVKVKVTDGNGCSDSMVNPINVSITPAVDAGNDTLVCAGSKITLNPTGASTYTWQTNLDLSCTSCTNPVAKPDQPAVYYVTGTSNGCSASDSIVVDAQTKEKVTVQPDAYAICQGNSVTLNATGADSYSWSPTNTLNNSTIPNPVATPAASTVYTVIGKDNNNCFADTAFVNVKINQLPTANITDSMVQLMTGTTYTIHASTSADVNSFKWSPGTDLSCTDCLQPVATINNTITYTLNTTNEWGCSNKDSISIIAICTDQYIFVPNTFSPNNDGMNDYFFPRSGAGISIKSLTIFNRWGQMIFQKKNFPVNNSNAGWDGRYKNVPQAADAYVYMMELNCSGNKTFVKKGTITLLR